MNREITYIGWLEGGNLGDEAIFAANKLIFSSYKLVPDKVRRGHQYSRITLFGGGTVIPTVSYWVRPNKYNYAFGVGVRDLTFWPEFNSDDVLEKTKEFKFRFLGVRGKLSKELLKGWGIESDVIGDPCLILEPSPNVKRRNDLVVLNISSVSRIYGLNRTRVIREAIKICKTLKSEKFSVVIVPFCNEDLPFIEKVSGKANVGIFEKWRNIQATIDFVASSKILIGERLHAAIFSAIAHTPFIMIAYQPKCFDFVGTMGFEKFTVRTDEITTGKVSDLFNGLLDNWICLHRTLIENVKIYRKKLMDFAGRIENDIMSLPGNKWSKPNLVDEVRWRFFHQADRALYHKAPEIWQKWHQFRRRS